MLESKLHLVHTVETREMKQPANTIPMALCEKETNTSPLSLERLDHSDSPRALKPPPAVMPVICTTVEED